MTLQPVLLGPTNVATAYRRAAQHEDEQMVEVQVFTDAEGTAVVIAKGDLSSEAEHSLLKASRVFRSIIKSGLQAKILIEKTTGAIRIETI